MQTIYIDISNKGVIPTIYAKQGDVGRKFLVVFTESGLPYDIPTSALFSAWYKGSSGEGNYTDIGESSAFSVLENKVEVEIISQMLGTPGSGFICLVLTKRTGGQIGSWNIPYICEEIPGFESEEAKDYYTAFSKLASDLAESASKIVPDKTLTEPNAPADSQTVGNRLDGKLPRLLVKGVDYGESVPESIPANRVFFVPDKTKDFIVEQGVSGDWMYRKWDSGVCEVFGHYLASNTSAGDNVFEISLPAVLSNRRYTVNITPTIGASSISKMGSCDINGNYANTNEKLFVFATLGGAYLVDLDIQIVGQWD